MKEEKPILASDHELLISSTIAECQKLAQERLEDMTTLDSSTLANFMIRCPALSFLKDIGGRYLFVNTAFEEHLDVSGADLLGHTGEGLLPSDVIAKLGKDDQVVLAGGEAKNLIEMYSASNKNQVREWLLCKFRCLNEQGKPLVAGICFDLGKPRQPERQLQGQAELLELILNNIGDPVIAVDAAGKLLLFNPAAIRLYGMGISGNNQTRAKDRFGIFLPDCSTPYPQERLPLARAIRGETVTDLEIFVRTAEQPHGAFLSARAQPILDANGTLKGGAAVFRDITLRKRAEEDLQNSIRDLKEARDEAIEASELKSQFVANISHELRTPMSGVLGMTELLMETALSHDQKELCKYIYESSQNLLSVLNELLDFSRLEAGTLNLDRGNFAAQTIVDEAIASVTVAAGRKRIKISAHCDNLPSTFIGDGRRVKQVLLHFLQNAVKFTEKGAIEIRVTVEKRVDDLVTVRFNVKDTGIGIAEADQQNMFSPFVQVDGTSTRKYGGVGLGLSICKRVVKLMSGKLGVTSKVGEGSNFWFTIPLECRD